AAANSRKERGKRAVGPPQLLQRPAAGADLQPPAADGPDDATERRYVLLGARDDEGRARVLAEEPLVAIGVCDGAEIAEHAALGQGDREAALSDVVAGADPAGAARLPDLPGRRAGRLDVRRGP